MIELIQHPSLFHINLILKIGFLILLGIYIIFAIMLLNKIHSFHRIIRLSAGTGRLFVQIFSYMFVLLLLFLFIFVLVIV